MSKTMTGSEAGVMAMAGQRVRRKDFHPQCYVEWDETTGLMECWSPMPGVIQRVPLLPGRLDQEGEWVVVDDKPIVHSRSIQSGFCEGCGAPDGMTCDDWAQLRSTAEEALAADPNAVEKAMAFKRRIDSALAVDVNYVSNALLAPKMVTLMVRYNAVLNTQTMRRDARKALDKLDASANRNNKDYIDAAAEAAALMMLLMVVRTSRPE